MLISSVMKNMYNNVIGNSKYDDDDNHNDNNNNNVKFIYPFIYLSILSSLSLQFKKVAIHNILSEAFSSSLWRHADYLKT